MSFVGVLEELEKAILTSIQTFHAQGQVGENISIEYNGNQQNFKYTFQYQNSRLLRGDNGPIDTAMSSPTQNNDGGWGSVATQILHFSYELAREAFFKLVPQIIPVITATVASQVAAKLSNESFGLNLSNESFGLNLSNESFGLQDVNNFYLGGNTTRF